MVNSCGMERNYSTSLNLGFMKIRKIVQKVMIFLLSYSEPLKGFS